MIRVGIIGCGKIAQVRHIPEYLENRDVTLVGLFDYNEERLDKLSKKYKIKSYISIDEMLNDKSVDAISICTPNIYHASLSIKALRANKHVLCEKPMATSLPECIAMIDVSKETNKKLMIGQNQRLNEAHIVAKDLIERGTIGKVLSFRTTFGHSGPESWSIDPGKNVWFFKKEKATMGAMADLGIHKTDLIQYLINSNIIAVTSKLVTLDKKDSTNKLIDIDDNAFCIYEMANGAVGTMHSSWSMYGDEDNSTIIYGDKGIMRIYDDKKHSIIIKLKDGNTKYYDIDEIQTNDKQSKSKIIDAFVDSIVNDKTPIITNESVLSAMSAVFASVESSKTNKRVEVKNI